ncbi:MAG TPA: hypothetical protein VF621_10110 [Pyrinomonadaceae bacterium]
MRGKFSARSLLSFLREYVGDRRRSPRRGARFAARVPAVVTLLEVGSENVAGASRTPSVAGETRDLGPSGLTLRLERIRVGGQYLTDADHHLGVRLELPAGEVALLAKAVRFEQPSEGGGEPGYLLGLRILRVREEDRDSYSAYMRTLMPVERRRRERERGAQGPLGWATPGAEVIPTEVALTTKEIARAFEKFVGQGRPGGRS